MKIIHCADLHLDSRLSGNLTAEQAAKRRQEILTTFRKMADYAASHDVKAIIIAGDLYDKPNISAATRNVITEVICRHKDIEFYYLRGNHDAENMLNSFDVLPENLHLFSEREWISYALSQEICITGIELTRENNPYVYDRLSLNPARYNIVVLHGQTAEISVSENAGKTATAVVSAYDQQVNSPYTGSIALKSLQNRNIDYLALGHVHKPARGRLDARGVWCYSGCLEGRGFDECGSRGFVLLDIEERSHRVQVNFVPFAARTLHDVSVNISYLKNSQTAYIAVKEALQKESIRKTDLVKIHLVGVLELDSDINTDYLAGQFENSFYVVKIVNETKYVIDYASFSKDISLKGEFVRTVEADTSLTEEEKSEIIRCGIRLLLGETDYVD